MKGKWITIAALLLAAALVVTAPGLTGAARAVNLEEACALTVAPGGGEIAQDLADAGVVVDLYKVADAEGIPGSDGYLYEMEVGYEALQIPADIDQDGWTALEQKAAEIALDGKDPTVKDAPAGEKIEGLEAGLYLVIAHGPEEDYTVTLEGEDGTSRLATTAHSAGSVYTFLPELVSLPGRETLEDGTYGPWQYEVEITLKPDQGPRFGSLEIVKTLTGYNAGTPATFVFSVEATLNGRRVYSDVVSVTFTAEGQKSILIDRIPVGAEVTVTEVYSGASYTLVSENDQTVVIGAEDTVSVEFVNQPTTEVKTGGAITNSFAYNEEGGWTWTPVPDVP